MGAAEPAPRIAHWRGALALGVALACPAAEAGGPLWQGTIGKAAVVVELDPAAPGLAGQYFYRRHLRDIPLDGERDRQGALHLAERADWRSERQPGWTVRLAADGTLQGEWRGLDGKRLPVRLQPLAQAALPPPHDAALAAMRSSDPYRYLQLSALRLQPSDAQLVGDYRLRWYVEPRTGARLFQIEAGYTPATRARLNRSLRQRHWQQVASALECLSGPDSDYESTTTLRRIDAQVVSVSLFSSYFCGGAHPDFGDAPLNLDPRTGRELALEDVLWLGHGTPPGREGADQAAWLDYRDKVLAPWLAARMKALYPKRMLPDGEDGCDYGDPDVWSFPSWYARADGLYLGPSFARVARACEYPDWSVLPWREVAAHPGAVDLRPR